MNSTPGRLYIDLPSWLDPFISSTVHDFVTPEKRMIFVLSIARQNIDNRTGGPFAAAVFTTDTHELIAAGMNLVTSSGLSIAHAEMVALSYAQKKLGSYDLGSPGLPSCELVTSTAPCAMCLGAIPWSGVRRLVCGARDQDARSIGFDEGPKIDNWVHALEQRNIKVLNDICRTEAVEVLNHYARTGGVIYNGRGAVNDKNG